MYLSLLVRAADVVEIVIPCWGFRLPLRAVKNRYLLRSKPRVDFVHWSGLLMLQTAANKTSVL